MNFSHTLTLMAPYNLNDKNIGKVKIIPILTNKEGETIKYDCPPSMANVFGVAVMADFDTYTLAHCPDFKTADAFVKIIDSLLQSFQ